MIALDFIILLYFNQQIFLIMESKFTTKSVKKFEENAAQIDEATSNDLKINQNQAQTAIVDKNSPNQTENNSNLCSLLMQFLLSSIYKSQRQGLSSMLSTRRQSTSDASAILKLILGTTVPKKQQLQQVLKHLHTHRLTTKQLIIYLEKKKIIRFIRLDLFLLTLEHIIQDTKYYHVFETLLQKYYAFEEQARVNKIQQAIPIVTGTELDFFYQKLRWFTDFFSKQIKQAKSSQMGQYHEQKTKNGNAIGESFYQFQKRSPTQEYIEENLLEQPKDQDTYQHKIPINIMKQIIDEENRYETPMFLLQNQNNKPRQSIKRLLSIDVTSVFQKELNEVKTLFIEQLQHNQYIRQIYTIFLQRYLQYYDLKQGEHDSSIDHEKKFKSQFTFYQKTYLQDQYNKVHFYKDHKSNIITYWEQFKKNFQKSNDAIIDEKIIERLNNIRLYYTPCQSQDKIFAQTNSTQFLININHINSDLTIEQYRQGPLKPYLLLCLYHEFAHELLRFGKNKKIDVSNHSFDVNSKSLGSQILHIIKQKKLNIETIFNKLNIKSSDTAYARDQNKNIILTSIQQLLTIFEEYKDISIKLGQYFEIIKDLEKKLVSIESILQKGRQIFAKQALWENLYDDIANNYKNTNFILQDNVQWNTDKERSFQYSLIEALFICQQYLKIGRQSQKYKFAKNIYEKNKNPLYFSSQIPHVDHIIESIKNKNINFFSKSPQFYTFINLFKQPKAYQSLWNQIKSINEQFSPIFDRITVYLSKLSEHLTWISKPDYVSRYKCTQSNQNKKLLENIIKVISTLFYYQEGMKFLKHSQIYIIATELSDLIFYQLQDRVDTGFYCEKLMFPSLITHKKIYAKDYNLLKTLNHQSAQKIGQMPKDQIEKNKSQFVNRDLIDDKPQQDVIQMNGHCGVQLHGYNSLRHLSPEMTIFNKAAFNSQQEYEKFTRDFLNQLKKEKKMSNGQKNN